jgi:fibronectin type 3 domain-containing protein
VVQVALSGTGTALQPDQHSVALDWSPSASAAVGYNIYRAIASGGPYGKVNASMDPDPRFIDSGIASGGTYFYVVTSIGSDNVESGFSNQVTVSVP